MGLFLRLSTSHGVLQGLLWLGCVVSLDTLASTDPGTALRARYEAARTQSTPLVANHPMYLLSEESQQTLKGEVFAALDQPFSLVRQATTHPDDWCSILILHLNIKYCHVTAPAAGETAGTMVVAMGRKYDQPLNEVYWVRFNYRVLDNTPDHLHVELAAPEGPLGTRDYRLSVEAVPLAEANSLVAITYTQAYGFAARWAFQAYLATLGHDKVGFSVVGQTSDGQPEWVSGLRGVLERNAMRYHLAIEAWLSNQNLPQTQRMEASLRDWFNATEQFPRQLREVSWGQYITMKRREVLRQWQSPVPKEVLHHLPVSP